MINGFHRHSLSFHTAGCRKTTTAVSTAAASASPRAGVLIEHLVALNRDVLRPRAALNRIDFAGAAGQD